MGTLRLFFAFSVLLGHIQLDCLISPIYAVQGFYIISGFYMALILNEKYHSDKQNTLFYKKRLFRLLPTYWLIASISMFIAILYYIKGDSSILFFDFYNFPTDSSLLTYLYIITTNTIVWGQDLSLFLGISPISGNPFFSATSFAEQYPMLRYTAIPVAWSVSSELSFYLIAPFILRNRKKTVFVLFIISIFSNIITNHYGLNDSNWRFRFFPSILMYFLAGYYAYLIYKRIEKTNIQISNNYIILIISPFLLTLFLRTNLPYVIHSGILLVTCTLTIPFLFYFFKSNKHERTIGEISYPLYLVHPTLIGINELAHIDNKLFIILGSVLAAYTCYIFFIKKIEIRRNSIK